MATASQVVQAIAEVTGVPVTTVVQIDRVLTASGLRAVGGRGRGAPAVTPRDAAAMLMATIGSSTVKDSGRPVERHGRMMSNGTVLGIADLDDLPADHTFHDALAVLLTLGGRGDLGEAEEINPDLPVRVTVLEPMTWSEISVGEVTRVYAIPRKGNRGNLDFDPPNDIKDRGDLQHRHFITNRTIVHIGLILGATTK